MTSVQSSTKTRFEHFFAGHSDAVTPQTPRRPPTSTEVQELEGKLRAATSALEAADAKQAELLRELSHVRLDKQQIETTLGMDLQQAEETITALEKERRGGKPLRQSSGPCRRRKPFGKRSGSSCRIEDRRRKTYDSS
ncbi:hypothetical protein QCA50_000934 [Cerrena zonata]|uniref:Uncharacterized protein n=1 Tax=Cerrena zonata TaxID=2478898 RepID=A0AAW0H0A8_9APHY